MIPKISVPDPLDKAITMRALVLYARVMIGEATDPAQDVVKRLPIIRTARAALDLAETLAQELPNMPAEFPEEYDAELLVWLKNIA